MKKKGFTLIELLAVIVILAIIALIATPIVLNIIKDSKESATLQSAQFYLDAVEHSITKKMMDVPTFKPKSCDVQSDGNLKCNGIDVKVEVSGEKPSSGKITLENGKIQDVQLVLSEKTIVKNTEGKLAYGEPEVQLQSGLYDAEGNLIASWDELVKAGIDLEKDYMDEHGELIVAPTELTFLKLSQGELTKGIKLVIDSSVNKIGIGALGRCTNLKEIIIPNSVTSIGEAAFAVCEGLKEIIIPDSVTSIGEYAFQDCIGIKEIVIPNSVTSIGAFAFVACENLTEVKLSNKMTRIEDHTFYGCANLKKVYIPKGIISIGTNAFNAAGLIEVTLPDSVTTLETGAISGNKNLTSVTIPNSVTTIDKYALASNEKLTTINYTGTEAEWNAITFGEGWNKSSPINKINYDHKIN